MGFRADIQGLRAIAVLGVVLFHLDLEWIPGGFVGVDLFFVISGYLISGILAREIQAGTFTFASFYERRVRRILPAFQVVCLATVAAGWWLLLPTSLDQLVRSAIASTLLVSNVFFWKETAGYFGAESSEQPLLHNWSLSVEEQFYLLWPVTLWLGLRFMRARPRAMVWAIAAIALVSFALAEWGSGDKASAAYFLLPTRAGEFLVGALLVFLPESGARRRTAWNELRAALGLALVLAANLLLDEHARFPGWNAVWPCVGAALLIHSGRQPTFVSRVLGVSPLVFIGTISYSFYLWHWPPIAFLHYFGLVMTVPQKAAAFGAMILVAWGSWRWIEEPVRRMTSGVPKPVWALALLPLAVQAVLLGRIDTAKPAFRGLGEIANVPGNCGEGQPVDAYPAHCLMGRTDASPTFVLWGDSYAGTLADALGEKALESQASGYLFSISMCPSIVGVKWNDGKELPSREFSRSCARYNEGVLDFVLASPDVHTVVLTSNYFWYIGQTSAGLPLVVPQRPDESIEGAYRLMIERLVSAGKRVVIVMPHPSDKALFNHALRTAYLRQDLESLTVPRAPTIDRITTMVEELSRRLPIDRVYPDRLMCEDSRCHVFDLDGDLYLSDGAHLTPKTTFTVVRRFPRAWLEPQAGPPSHPPIHVRHAVHARGHA